MDGEQYRRIVRTFKKWTAPGQSEEELRNLVRQYARYTLRMSEEQIDAAFRCYYRDRAVGIL